MINVNACKQANHVPRSNIMAWWPNIYRIQRDFLQEKIFANTRFWQKVNLFRDFFSRSENLDILNFSTRRNFTHVLITQSAVVPDTVDFASLERPRMRVRERRTSVCV